MRHGRYLKMGLCVLKYKGHPMEPRVYEGTNEEIPEISCIHRILEYQVRIAIDIRLGLISSLNRIYLYLL